jgi:uncharacterized protein (DUF1778 family)
MARTTNDPVPHIITFRVNSEEKKVLTGLAKKSGRTISDFIRRELMLIKATEKWNW